MKFLKPTTFLCLATTISSTLITPVFADSKEVNYDINNMSTKYHNNDLITINCRKAPFFRYGDIRQGFIKNVRKLVAN